MTLSLQDSIGTNWDDITTAKQLRGALRQASKQLRLLGHNTLADDWVNRLKHMPKRMDKEAINYVLLSANWELKRLGITDYHNIQGD